MELNLAALESFGGSRLSPWIKLVALVLIIALIATGVGLALAMKPAPAATRTGYTLWFQKWEVGLWATAGTAAVIGLLVATFGISIGAAWGMVGVLVGTFWAAVGLHRCAWLTLRPFSTGTYSC